MSVSLRRDLPVVLGEAGEIERLVRPRVDRLEAGLGNRPDDPRRLKALRVQAVRVVDDGRGIVEERHHARTLEHQVRVKRRQARVVDAGFQRVVPDLLREVVHELDFGLVVDPAWLREEGLCRVDRRKRQLGRHARREIQARHAIDVLVQVVRVLRAELVHRRRVDHPRPSAGHRIQILIVALAERMACHKRAGRGQGVVVHVAVLGDVPARSRCDPGAIWKFTFPCVSRSRNGCGTAALERTPMFIPSRIWSSRITLPSAAAGSPG